jgi:hypothetical protein
LNAGSLRTVLSGIALLAAAWRLVPETRPVTAPSSNQAKSDYVDPAICASCHQGIAKSYQLTGMGHSFYRPTTGNAIEDYKGQNAVHNEPSRLAYTMVERDGKFYQRRSEVGFDGQETNGS